MQANHTKLNDIISGAKQFMVPIYQRPYTWGEVNWKRFWSDLRDLYEDDGSKAHFMGSVVTMPTSSVPEGVPKYLLIDGQQRFTTISILLAILKNIASESKSVMADEINDYYLINKYKNGTDRFRLLPTRSDRDAYGLLVEGNGQSVFDSSVDHQMIKAYKFFDRSVRRDTPNLERLKDVIVKRLGIVSIVLDTDDNANVVFEGLNAAGQPLTQADLIRNFFIMKVHTDQQETVYQDMWVPIEKRFSRPEVLNEFMRHFLMRKGKEIKKNEVYFSLKDEVDATNAKDKLKELLEFSSFYEKLLDPIKEPSEALSKALFRLNKFDVNLCFPFLLNLYSEFSKAHITDRQFVEALTVIENFFIRRFIRGTPTHGLHKVFAALFNQIDLSDLKESLSSNLAQRDYPTDSEIMKPP